MTAVSVTLSCILYFDTLYLKIQSHRITSPNSAVSTAQFSVFSSTWHQYTGNCCLRAFLLVDFCPYSTPTLSEVSYDLTRSSLSCLRVHKVTMKQNGHHSISVHKRHCLCCLTALETKQHPPLLLCIEQSLLQSNVGHSVFYIEVLGEVGAETQYPLAIFWLLEVCLNGGWLTVFAMKRVLDSVTGGTYCRR